jgi:hypothetical protein
VMMTARVINKKVTGHETVLCATSTQYAGLGKESEASLLSTPISNINVAVLGAHASGQLRGAGNDVSVFI